MFNFPFECLPKDQSPGRVAIEREVSCVGSLEELSRSPVSAVVRTNNQPVKLTAWTQHHRQS